MISRFVSAILFIIIGFVIVFSSCKKDDNIDTNPAIKLSFSSDTLIFDTVFSTIGSITELIKVYNPSDNKVNISTIRLAKGANSRYSINVNGESGIVFNDVEIQGNDSIFLFAKVTINPNDDASPFIVTDSILFETNGNPQDIDLVAWGQNAGYILWNKNPENLPKYRIVAGEGVDTTWTNELPIVVYGYAVVDSTGSLTIEAGTKVHFHSGSGLWIYKGGSLKVMGTQEEPVYFQGDRLEGFYSDLPGQWDRIWINEGAVDNEINYAIIRNGFIGLQLETLQEFMGNQLFLNNTIIENMSGAGILTRYYFVAGQNCVIANCGQYALALTLGGGYDFRHTTIGNYWRDGIRTSESVYLNNYFIGQNNQVIAYPFYANIANSIIYGNQNEELVIDDSVADFSYTFDHCLIKTELNIALDTNFKFTLKNEDPLFLDPSTNNLQPDSLSPVIGAGSFEVANTVPLDINGISRTDRPDLGAYQWTPTQEERRK
ncbi:MAG: hypothetical protein K9H16_05950 [Bacteroidales bacterium]|nr:hypothetical protein [Bacteroidales bacterium]